MGGQTEGGVTSVFFAAFIIAAVVNGFNCRVMDGKMPAFFSGNPVFFLVMGGIVFIQILIIQYGGAVFGTVPLTTTEWVTIAGAAAVPVIVLGFIVRSLFAWHRAPGENPGRSLNGLAPLLPGANPKNLYLPSGTGDMPHRTSGTRVEAAGPGHRWFPDLTRPHEVNYGKNPGCKTRLPLRHSPS